MNLSRRNFLGGLGGVASLPLAVGVSSNTGLASASAAEIIASSPPITVIGAGVPGNAATRHFSAGASRETFSSWCDRMGFSEALRPTFLSQQDVIEDSNEGVSCCSRCGGAVAPEELREACGDRVCLECLTYGESLLDDEDRGMNELADLIMGEGELSAREFITLHEDFETIGEDRWKRAVAIAAARGD